MNPKEIVLPEGDGPLACWCQVSPYGIFPAEQDGREVDQLIDAEACTRLEAAMTEQVLVDFEHRSEEENSDTLASGWVQKLRHSEENGLEAYIEWTDVGANDVRAKRRRFLSGVWRIGPDGRPIKVISIALTNKPRMATKPILNKAPADTIQSGEPTVGAPQQKEQENMKEIAAIYGLPETATPAEIAAAAKSDRDKIEALQKELDAIKQSQLEAEATKVTEENSDRIANKEAFRDLYIKNKAAAEQFLSCLPAKDKKPICNKDDAKLPSFAKGTGKTNAYTTWSSMPDGASKDAYFDAHADEINDNYPN